MSACNADEGGCGLRWGVSGPTWVVQSGSSSITTEQRWGGCEDLRDVSTEGGLNRDAANRITEEVKGRAGQTDRMDRYWPGDRDRDWNGDGDGDMISWGWGRDYPDDPQKTGDEDWKWTNMSSKEKNKGGNREESERCDTMNTCSEIKHHSRSSIKQNHENKRVWAFVTLTDAFCVSASLFPHQWLSVSGGGHNKKLSVRFCPQVLSVLTWV